MDSLQLPDLLVGCCQLKVDKTNMPDGSRGFMANALFPLTKTFKISRQSYHSPGVFSCMRCMAEQGPGVDTPLVALVTVTKCGRSGGQPVKPRQRHE